MSVSLLFYTKTYFTRKLVFMSSKFCNCKIIEFATYIVVVQPNNLEVRELLKFLELCQATVRKVDLGEISGVFSVLNREDAVGRGRVGLNFNHFLSFK